MNQMKCLMAVALVGLMGCAKKAVVAQRAAVHEAVDKVFDEISVQRPFQGSQEPDEYMAWDSRDLSPVFFAYDSATLLDFYRERLARNAELLKRNASLTVVIEGSTDERGTNGYNLALGERRAQAVKAYYEAQGIDAARIRTVSYGEERLACVQEVDAKNEEACHAVNRRADTRVDGGLR